MSITSTITAQWDDLSAAAQEHIRATRPHLFRKWILSEDGYEFASVEADSLDEAIEDARETVDTSCYDTRSGYVYTTIYVVNAVTRESGSFSLVVAPPEPACADGHEHQWMSPHSVLGGDEANPGVWGHGGGVYIREVCCHCGRYRLTDTWAQRMDTGEQGLRETTYEVADDASLAWIERRALGAAERIMDSLPYVTRYERTEKRRDDGRYYGIRVSLCADNASDLERALGETYSVDPTDSSGIVIVSVY